MSKEKGICELPQIPFSISKWLESGHFIDRFPLNKKRGRYVKEEKFC